jgi:hypothetical protein
MGRGATDHGHRHTLSHAERHVLAAVARALLEGDDDWPAADEVGAAGLAEQLIASLPGPARRRVRLALRLVEWLAVPIAGGRFSRLSPGRQRSYLAGWARSRLTTRRLVLRSLQSIVSVGYYSAEPVRRRLLGAGADIP